MPPVRAHGTNNLLSSSFNFTEALAVGGGLAAGPPGSGSSRQLLNVGQSLSSSEVGEFDVGGGATGVICYMFLLLLSCMMRVAAVFICSAVAGLILLHTLTHTRTPLWSIIPDASGLVVFTLGLDSACLTPLTPGAFLPEVIGSPCKYYTTMTGSESHSVPFPQCPRPLPVNRR